MAEEKKTFQKNKQMVCPVNCLYCMASRIDKRREYWEAGERIGMNKSCTFINRFPSDPPLKDMPIPWELLNGEYLGFQGITDCFWGKYEQDLEWLIGKVLDSRIKKLVLVSKIPVTDKQIELLKTLGDRIVVIYSVTGADALERTTTTSRLDAIKRLKEAGVDVLPIVHPYIAGYSDLSSFPILREIGVRYVSWKGLRYNPENMPDLKKFIPADILKQYEKNEDEVFLGKEVIEKAARDNHLEYVDLKDYIQKPNSVSGISLEEATREVEALAKMVVFSTSDKSKQDVIDRVIKRRTQPGNTQEN